MAEPLSFDEARDEGLLMEDAMNGIQPADRIPVMYGLVHDSMEQEKTEHPVLHESKLTYLESLRQLDALTGSRDNTIALEARLVEEMKSTAQGYKDKGVPVPTRGAIMGQALQGLCFKHEDNRVPVQMIGPLFGLEMAGGMVLSYRDVLNKTK
jgi:hypothetical protein